MANTIYMIISFIMIISSGVMLYLLLMNKKGTSSSKISQLEKNLKMWEEASWDIVENIKAETEKSLVALKRKEMEVDTKIEQLEKLITRKTKEWEQKPLKSISSAGELSNKLTIETKESKKEKVLKLKEKGYSPQEISQKLDINSGEVRVIFGLEGLKKIK